MELLGKLKKYRFFADLLKPESLHQFKRYLIIGFISFGIEYFSFFLLYKKIGMKYMVANTIVYVAIFWLNFLLNRFWSFKAKGNFLGQLIKYGTLFGFNLLAISGLLYTLSDIVGISPLISKVIVMGAVVCWNFVLYKKIIYR